MAQEPRIALQQFIAALERHFEAMSSKHGSDDPAVSQTYYKLEDAFLDYEESVGEKFEELLPFELADDQGDSN
ncbi:MAG: hypothetical protein ACKOWR_04420 [Micrococcales bacterium]|jgi:hypothetical protein